MAIIDSAKEILQAVGGASNVQELVHCYTRLRFTLKDDSIPNDKEIEKIKGVKGVNRASGQYQVIIGSDVPTYFEVLQPLLTNVNKENDRDQKPKGNLWDRFVNMVTSILIPVIPALVGGGMIKVLLSVLTLVGWLSSNSENYRLLSAIGDAPFYFLTMIVAVFATRFFKVNTALGVGLIGFLVYPDVIKLLGKGHVSFFGLPVYPTSYTSAIIPIILIIWVMSYVEPLVNKVVPKLLRTVLVPIITLLIMGILGIVILGPIGNIISLGLSNGMEFIYEKTGVFAYILFAAIYGPMVITGLHQGLGPVILQNMATLGYEPFMMAGALASNMAQGAAALAVSVKAKNPEIKSEALGSSISALFGGVTEPALFGINLRYKKPLYVAVIAAACGGLVAGIFKVKTYVMVSPALLSIAGFIGGKGLSNVIGAILVIITTVTLSFIFTLIVWKDETITDEEVKEKPVVMNSFSEIITSPLKGEFKKIEDVPDITFAKKLMGEGAAVVPSVGCVVAPFDGTVVTVFPTKHAIGIKSDEGTELLIHIGLETVNLKGQYFDAKVKDGDKISKGQELLTFDLDGIKAAGYNPISPVIVTNMQEVKEVDVNNDLKVVDTDTSLLIAKA